MLAKKKIGKSNFVEIYLSTPLNICETRDVKGLYNQARMGQIENMTGINSLYQIPKQPDIIIDTSNRSVLSCVDEIILEMDL